jgi:small subunit ribosomal protein S6
MAMYETIFILDSLLSPDDIESNINRVKEVIESQGGKVTAIDRWGKRRLAYEIHKKQYGFYVAIEFDSTGNLPQFLQSEYNYNDKILRYLTYRYAKNKIKARNKELELRAQGKEPIPIRPEAEFEAGSLGKGRGGSRHSTRRTEEVKDVQK